MVEARRRDEWQRTAALRADVANIMRDPKKRRRPFQPWEFDPMQQSAQRARPAITISMKEFIALYGDDLKGTKKP